MGRRGVESARRTALGLGWTWYWRRTSNPRAERDASRSALPSGLRNSGGMVEPGGGRGTARRALGDVAHLLLITRRVGKKRGDDDPCLYDQLSDMPSICTLASSTPAPEAAIIALAIGVGRLGALFAGRLRTTWHTRAGERAIGSTGSSCREERGIGARTPDVDCVSCSGHW